MARQVSSYKNHAIIIFIIVKIRQNIKKRIKLSGRCIYMFDIHKSRNERTPTMTRDDE